MAVKQRDNLARELELLPAGQLKAHLNEMKDLEVEINGKVHEKVRLVRSFPLTDERKYITLVDPKDQEIGIIEDLDDCVPEVNVLFTRLLDDAYLVPVISRVQSITQEGLVPVWEVETDRGQRRIEMRSRRDVIPLGTRLLLRDADGNRYEIPDYTRLDGRSRRLVEQEI